MCRIAFDLLVAEAEPSSPTTTMPPSPLASAIAVVLWKRTGSAPPASSRRSTKENAGHELKDSIVPRVIGHGVGAV